MSFQDPIEQICFISENPEERIPIPDICLSQNVPVTYPSDWFAKNPGLKPILTLPCPRVTLDEARVAAYAGLVTRGTTVKIAKMYLAELMLSMPQVLDQQWASFNRLIGNAGEAVTIGDICPIQYGNDIWEPVVMQHVPTADDDKWMIIFLCGIYRVFSTSNLVHRNKIIGHIDQMLIQNGRQAGFYPPNVIYHESFMQDKQFRKLMARIDMFYVQFPEAPHSQARIGTVPARFHDCGVLNDLAYVTKIMDVTYMKFTKWLWAKSAALDMLRVSKIGEEINVVESYMPYMMELGLSNRSPYSITANASLHYFIHVIGCVMGMTRSMNARLVGQIPMGALNINGLMAGFAMCSVAMVKPHFADKGVIPDTVQVIIEADEEGEEGVDSDPLPDDLNPYKWYGYLLTHKRQLSNKAKLYLSPQLKSLNAPREGSIGHYLKTYTITPDAAT